MKKAQEHASDRRAALVEESNMDLIKQDVYEGGGKHLEFGLSRFPMIAPGSPFAVFVAKTT